MKRGDEEVLGRKCKGQIVLDVVKTMAVVNTCFKKTEELRVM